MWPPPPPSPSPAASLPLKCFYCPLVVKHWQLDHTQIHMKYLRHLIFNNKKTKQNIDFTVHSAQRLVVRTEMYSQEV